MKILQAQVYNKMLKAQMYNKMLNAQVYNKLIKKLAVKFWNSFHFLASMNSNNQVLILGQCCSLNLMLHSIYGKIVLLELLCKAEMSM